MATNNVLIQKYQGATSGYNQINPLTVDEDLNARIGFASGSTSKDIIDYNSQFWWKRKAVGSTFKKTETILSFNRNNLETTCFATWSYSTENQGYVTINYSEAIDFDAGTGKFALKNPSSLRFQRIVYGNASVKATGCENLIGKYVERVVDGQVNGEICYLPKEYQGNTNTYVNQYWSGASGHPYALHLEYGGITLLGSVSIQTVSWEKVSSNSCSAYPVIGEQGDYYYEQLGNPVKDWKNMAKIDFGEYMGTGDSEFTLAFEFLPKLVIVVPESGTYSLNISGESLYAVLGSKTYSSFYRTAWTGGSVNSGTIVYFEWKENSFHATNVSGLNQVNKKYQYIAFG